MKDRLGIFLQARLSSSRLPGKALLQIQNKTIISHAMTTLKCLNANVYLLLTDYDSYEKLRPEADACGFKTFKGSAEDVLDRFTCAAEFYKVKTIIRATGDNPLVDAEAAALILKSHNITGADYSGFSGMPLGTGVEILDYHALIIAKNESKEEYDHEHVSPFLYKNPERFIVNKKNAPKRFCSPESRVTIDTKEDFSYVSRLFAELYKGKPLGIQEIIPWLEKNRRE